MKGEPLRVKPRSALLLAATLFFTAAQASAGEVIKVKIDKLAFAPAELSARVGDTLEWENADFIAHSATDATEPRGAFDVMIPAGATRRLLLKKAGTFPYYCRFHPTMKGELHVM